MNGSEKAIAISMSGLMSLGITEERAFELIEASDYCVNADWELVKDYLDDILNGVIEPKLEPPSQFDEDLFEL